MINCGKSIERKKLRKVVSRKREKIGRKEILKCENLT